jgi:hypothetical protein
MVPIAVRATVASAVALPGYAIALDSLLMAAVATRDDLPPLGFREKVEFAIPLAKERGIYLASLGLFEHEAYERRFLTKRFPLAEAQAFGDAKLKRVNMSAGLCKNYRIPMETIHLHNDAMTWFAIGDLDVVRDLLSWVHYLGKKRSVGLGRVQQWVVEECEQWDGFPVLRDGRPLRPLPLDWPGLKEYRVERRVLSPPYWERWRDEPCAVS